MGGPGGAVDGCGVHGGRHGGVRRALQGHAEARQHHVEAAVARLNDALARFRRLGDAYNEGRVHVSLGETHLEAEDADQARVCLDEAVRIMSQDGARPRFADAVETRAACHRLQGRTAREAADRSPR